MEFEKLVESVAPQNIRPGIEVLLKLKRNSPELGLGDPILEINNYITSELEQHGEDFRGQGRPDLLTKQESRDELNAIFRSAVRQEV